MCNGQIRLHSAISRTISENLGTKVEFFGVGESSQKVVPLEKMRCDSLANHRIITQNGHDIVKEGSHLTLSLIGS